MTPRTKRLAGFVLAAMVVAPAAGGAFFHAVRSAAAKAPFPPVFVASEEEAATIGMVFLGGNQRIAMGVSLLKAGAIQKLLLLSDYPREDVFRRFSLSEDMRKRIVVLPGAVNSSEEANSAMKWLRSEKAARLVIITDKGHMQRCYSLLSPLKNKYAIFGSWVDNGWWPRGERVKLGLTALGITRVPGYQVPYI